MKLIISRFKIFNFILFCWMATSIVSCVKTEFDEPPSSSTDPSINADQIISLEEVMKKRISGEYVKIDLDKYVQGVIIADDKSGNFYKTLVIEDEKSDYGISVLVDETEMHNTYPIGRRVFINLKNLWVSDYNGLPQMGYGPVINGTRKEMASIPSTLLKETILPGETGHEVTPVEVTISQLGALRLNTLIKIKDIQFENIGESYADAATQTTLNRNLVTCTKQEIVLRNSGFADFAGQNVAEGKGSIVAIYGIFGNTKQLTIRNVSDVDMKETRCGGITGDEPRFSIKQMREVFKGTTTNAPKSYIQGVVISDGLNKNIATRNLVIQEGDAGIVVRFAADHSFKLGQELKINCTDLEVSEFNSLLQLNNVPNGAATLVGQGTLPVPKNLNLKEIKDNLNTYESTLVVIKNVTLSGGSTYNGNITMTDASGTMILRTTSTATFSSLPLPSGGQDVTGIVSEFTTSTVTPQINMRSKDDVKSSGPVPCPNLGLNVGDACNDNNTQTEGDVVTSNCECKGSPISTNGQIIISELRSKYTGTKTTAPDGFIQGVVISDIGGKNIQAKNLVIQDGSGGIVVRLTADNTIPIGKEIKVKTNGVELSEFNKLLQLNNVPAANITEVGNGTLPSPKELTIASLKADFEKYESTLVLIKDGSVSGGSTFGGTLKVTDSSGSIDMFTRTDATFATQAVPAGNKQITAIASEFTTSTSTSPVYQVTLRNSNDIK